MQNQSTSTRRLTYLGRQAVKVAHWLNYYRFPNSLAKLVRYMANMKLGGAWRLERSLGHALNEEKKSPADELGRSIDHLMHEIFRERTHRPSSGPLNTSHPQE